MAERIAKTFYEILKFNPYHDSLGRFTTGGSATSFTIRTKDSSKQYMADMAIARAKEQDAASSKTTETKPKQNKKTTEKPQKETESKESARKQAIHDAEDRIRSQEYESAAIIDSKGNQLLFKDGKKSYVQFSPLESRLMANNTLTHNHPRCSMFSDADLSCMIRNNMYEMRATNRDGTTYSMKRAEKGYSSNAMDFVEKYEKEYFKSTIHAQRDLDSRGFQQKVNSGEITSHEANIEFGRSSAKYMADWTAKHAPDYGLEFSVEHREVKKSYRGRQVMKSDKNTKEDAYLVLDKETNALEDKAFKEWLERAKKSQRTAKSFNEVLKKGEK